MRKIIFFFAIGFFLSNLTAISAQNYFANNSDNIRTSVDGASANFFQFKKKRRSGPEPRQALGGVLFAALDGQATYFYGFTYNFAYPINEKLYIAANPSLGGVLEANSQSGGGFIFGFDLPVMAELHFGEQDAFGGILGLGFAYNFINSSNQEIPHKAIGPVAEAGIRFQISDRTYLVKASFQLNLTKKTFGITPNDYTTGNVLGITVATAF
jgi:hypothetical protein